MFKNMVVYRLDKATPVSFESLATHQFKPCGEFEEMSAGFVAPFDGDELTYAVPGGHLFAAYCIEQKNMPKQVIDRITRERCRELEAQQGFKPGRKQTKDVRSQVIDELLPRAFSTRNIIRIWFDPAGGWLVIDTPSYARADDVFRGLLKATEQLPVTALRTKRSPCAAMTDWLAADEAPAGFTVDLDTELRATGEGKATVRFINTLPVEDAQRHIAGGKQCTRLAMTWADRISFVLTDGLVLKRIEPLDVLKEGAEFVGDEQERRDSDLVLMVGEFGKLLSELVDALGGEE